jgi:hypothetical protein
LKSFVWIGWVSFVTTPFMNALAAILGATLLEAGGEA